MRLVINIAEKDYKRIKDIGPDVFESLISRVYAAVRTGTPLPDGQSEEDTEQPDRDEKEAFKMVFDYLKKVPMCRGEYDAKYGSEHYMYGISTVMEMIAGKISDEEQDAFSNMFNQNMIESKERQKDVIPPKNEYTFKNGVENDDLIRAREEIYKPWLEKKRAEKQTSNK